MAKTLHSRYNEIFLTMLRGVRQSQRMRQSDLARLLGRSQATVSNVERGERRLDLIELREWLEVLEVDFIKFLSALDAELQRLGVTGVRTHPRKRGSNQESRAVLKQARLGATDTVK
jgi:transcriptional regulator with XRE-family HTH domain